MTTRLPAILLLNAAGLALFFLPGISRRITVSGSRWIPGCSTSLTEALAKSEAFLWLVAITNNRAFDGCSLLAMGCLMLSFWLKEDKTGRRRILIIGPGDAADGRDYQPAGAASDAG